MWKRYLSMHMARSAKQEPLTRCIQKKFKKQFEYMTPKERWTAMSLIENKQLVKTVKQSTPKEEDIDLEEFEDTIYECEKCGSKKIDIIQKQLRSADEPATVFATCIRCGNKWTEN